MATVALYHGPQVPGAITERLRSSVDVITALENNSATMSDPDLLDRATALGRALVTSDADFLVEADRRQAAGIEFCGVVYAHSLRASIKTCIDDLELIAKTSDPSEVSNRVEYLPL